MSEDFAIDYKDGDIVWVKLGPSWWPAKVKDIEKLPPDILEFKKQPLAIVKFFDEDSYEYVRSWANIHPYNCDKKNDFIKKGMAAFRAKTPHMEKFPKDVTTAEVEIGGNPNILSDPIFIPEKKRNYVAEVFGTPKSKSIKDKKKISSKNKKDTTHITHRRFIGLDDYKAYICIQYPGKDRVPGDLEDDEVIRINREPEQEYKCHSCGFVTKRLEVMVLHTKSHIYGTFSPKSYKKSSGAKTKRKEKIKKPKRSVDTTATDSCSSDCEAPKTKKRKTKVSSPKKPIEEEKPQEKEQKKPVDFRSDLLAEWEVSEDELEEDISMQDQTTENESTFLDLTAKSEGLPTDQSAEKKPEDSIQEISDADVPGDTKVPPAHESDEVIEIIEDEDTLPPKTNPRQSPKPIMDKETQEAIKSCFDFDEDEEDEHALINTTAVEGRKIPRVIPPTERRKSDVLPDKEKDDEQLSTEEIDNAFKELMQATEVPELSSVHNTLKCEQNFHSVKTIKFPDKPENWQTVDSPAERDKTDSEEVQLKSDVVDEPSSKTDQEVATKLTNPKKRFVKCFEDFEHMQNEIRRKEEEEQSDETKDKDSKEAAIEERLEKRKESVETKADEAVSKLDQNVERQLETIFGSSLSKTPEIDEEDSLDYGSMKTKILSSILEEANLNEESKTKIISKMNKKHRSPRSKILESYLQDKTKEDDSTLQVTDPQVRDDVKKRLMPEASEEDASPTLRPNKETWTRRSHPKKVRHLFDLDDTEIPNEGYSCVASEISLSRPFRTKLSETSCETSKSATESRAMNESSKIEELLETLESSNEEDSNFNENTTNIKMDTVTIQDPPQTIEVTSPENVLATQQAEQSNEDDNREIAEICENIRKTQKEEESFPFNMLSPCEREEFSPIGNASRILPDDAICSPPKKNKKRKKSRHKSSKSKRRRKHSEGSESTGITESVQGSVTTTSVDENEKPIHKSPHGPVDSSVAAESNIEISTVADGHIDSSVRAEIPTDSSAVAELLVDGLVASDIHKDSSDKVIIDTSALIESPINSSFVDERPNDIPVVSEIQVDSPVISERPVDSSVISERPNDIPVVSEIPVDSPVISERPVGSSVISEKPNNIPVVSEIPVDSPIISERPVDSPVISERPTDSPGISERPINSPVVTEKPSDGPVVTESINESTPATENFADESTVANSSAVATYVYSPINSPAVTETHIEGSADVPIDHSAVSEPSFECSAVDDRPIETVKSDDQSIMTESSNDLSAMAAPARCTLFPESFLSDSTVHESSTTLRCSIDLSAVAESVDYSAISERFANISAAKDSSVENSPETEGPEDKNVVAESSVESSNVTEKFHEGSLDIADDGFQTAQDAGNTKVISTEPYCDDRPEATEFFETLSTIDNVRYQVHDQEQDQVKDQVKDQINKDGVKYHIGDQVTEIELGENSACNDDHVAEEVVSGDSNRGASSQETTIADLHTSIEETNDQILEYFESNNEVVDETVLLEENLKKSCDGSLSEFVENFDGVVSKVVEQEEPFTAEDIQNNAAVPLIVEKRIEEHPDLDATETHDVSHQVIESEAFEGETGLSSIVEELKSDEQVVNVEEPQAMLEETVESDEVVELLNMENKRDELAEIEDTVTLNERVDNEQEKQSEISIETNENEIAKAVDECIIDKDAFTVHEKRNEHLDGVQSKLALEFTSAIDVFHQEREVPSEVDIFHQDRSETVAFAAEQEVDSYDGENESFESVQNKSDNEVNLFEQEVVQEVNIETEQIVEMDHVASDGEICNYEAIRSETVVEDSRLNEQCIDQEKETIHGVASLEGQSHENAIFEETVTEEIHSEVDAGSYDVPIHFEDVVNVNMTEESNVVEQNITFETEQMPEVEETRKKLVTTNITFETKQMPEVEETRKELVTTDDNKEFNLVGAEKTTTNVEEDHMHQDLLPVVPEKIMEEVVTDILPDTKVLEETSAASELSESNKLEVKCVSDLEDEFKFSIQTNLSNLTSREEISAIALATLAEMKTDFENSDSNISEEIQPGLPFPDKLSEPELVAIEGNLTVVSEKDLADGQVEITSEKVISSKKPATLSTFSMDFSDSTNDSNSTNSDIIPKFLEFDSKGTEFSSKAITKELKPKSDLKKANTYERYELLDILEGNADMERRAEYHAPKKPFDTDMCDFEEHIPSQIVCSSKFKQDIDELKDEIKKKEKPHKSSIMSTTSKLLERLSESKPGDSFKLEVKTADGVSLGKEGIDKVFKPITLKSKPIIISEQIIKAATESKPVEKPKNMLNDIEDVEAFVIHKDIKKHVVEEQPVPVLSPVKPARTPRRKAGKANILQQTIITPDGEIIQPTLNAGARKRAPKQIAIKSITIKPGMMTTPVSKATGVNPPVSIGVISPLSLKSQAVSLPVNVPKQVLPKPQATVAASDDNVFDINSMPIVLSDEILTPESIENMPIVIGGDSPTGRATAQQKALPAKRPLQAKVCLSPVPTLLTAKPQSTTPKMMTRPRILQTATSKASKQPSPLLPGTPRPGKYILVPQGAVPQTATATTKVIAKKTVVKRTPTPTGVPAGVVAKPPSLAPEPSGNKIMIVTNQQGQQQRLLLTPAQQKMLGYQSQGARLTKTVMKGAALPKGVAIPRVTTTGTLQADAGTSKMPSLLGQKLIISTSSGQSLMAATSQVVTGSVPPQAKLLKTAPKPPQLPPKKAATSSGKTPKTILITSKQGHTVKKITTTEDDIEKQVAEQLEAIKARSAMKLGALPKSAAEPVGLPALCKTVHKTPSRRSYSKKAEQKPKAAAAATFGVAQQVQKTEVANVPPPLVSTSTPPRKVPTAHPSDPRKILPEEPKPHTDRPLNQLVIQDAVGNQTTITEGQILALPSETVGGHPQSYMLVTLDESGNLTPLNNEALLSLDPNLGLGGDLSNMVLQIDQGALAGGPEQAMPLAQSATVKLSHPGEALRAGTSKIDIPVDNAPVTIPVASTAALQETVIDARLTQQQHQQQQHQQNVLSIPDASVGMQPIVPHTNGEPGQQLIVTGDPIATQKFLESLTEGTTDLANILASAEGKSILIQADGQQILIDTNADNQMLLSVNNDGVNASESTEGGGNPIFATQPPNNKSTDILAAALADTDVFASAHSTGKMSAAASQLSPGGGVAAAALYPMNVGNVLETITLNSPIMTPLEVASTNAKKVADETDILSQVVPKNVDLPITITDPNIAQTVANQQCSTLMPNELQTNLELSLPMSEGCSTSAGGLTSPGYAYSLTTLDEGVDIAVAAASHKPFNSSMPLLNDDIEEAAQQPVPLSKKQHHHDEKKERRSDHRHAAEDVHSGGSFLEEESRFTLGGEMCSSLSEPPPEMFDIPEVNPYAADKHVNNIPLSLQGTPPDLSDGLSKDGDTTDLSTQAESSNDGSCEIPLQPRIVARGLDLSRGFDSIRKSSDGRM